MFINVNRQKLEALNTTFQKLFDQTVARLPDEALLDIFVREIGDPNFILEQFFSARLGSGMKEDTGEPEAGRIEVKSARQRIKRWYDAFSMDLEDFENDRLALYRGEVEAMAESYVKHRIALATSTLEAGFSDDAYDGSTFFGNHTTLSGDTNTNLVTGGFGEANLKEALRLISLMRDERGDLMGLRGNYLMVPPALEWDARKLVEANLTGGGDTNVLAGRLQVVVNPYLTSSTSAYVIDGTFANRKPIVFHVSRRPRLTPDTTKVVSREEIEWYLRAKYNAYLAFYQTVVAITQ